MFGFGSNNKNDNPWDFWGSNSDDEGWGFGGSQDKQQTDDICGMAERDGKSFWETLTDFFFR